MAALPACAPLQEEAKQYGLVVGKDFAANAERFNDNLTRLKLIVEGVFLKLADALLPELVKFSEILLDLIKSVGVHNTAVEVAIRLYKDFATGLALVSSVARRGLSDPNHRIA
jgi:hypothetical protein